MDKAVEAAYRDRLPWVRRGGGRVLEERIYINRDGSRLPVLVFPALERAGAMDRGTGDCARGSCGGTGGIAQHMITTRLGGVSEGVFRSLNLSTGRGDQDSCVRENIARVAAAFGTDPAHLVFSHQVHATNVLRVTPADAGTGAVRPVAQTGVDGLVTNEAGLVLGIFCADCVPLLFVDPVHRAVGVSHSGWRGTVGRMGQKTLEVMRREFGTRPEEVLAGIGPSICGDHYEISEDVAQRFREEFPDTADAMLRYAGKPGHEQLDLWEACRVTLLQAGVPERNISVTDICTCCNPELLFSHRASQGRRGNIGAFIMLRPAVPPGRTGRTAP